MAKHARLSASTSSRWMNCPGSVKLSEALPPSPSNEYALLGTASHLLCERCITEGKEASDYLGMVIRMEGDDAIKITQAAPSGNIPAKDFLITEDIVSAVQVYVDYVSEILSSGDEVISFVERSFKELQKIHPDMGGTGDFSTIKPYDISEIVDYKNGAGVCVEVNENSQLLIYATGAYLFDPSVEKVKITIIQPRMAHRDGPIRSAIYTAKEIERFMVKLKKAAKVTEKNNAKISAGSWCRFCPVLSTCPEIKKTALVECQTDFDDPPPVLGKKETLPMPDTVIETARVLTWMPILEAWFKAVASKAKADLEAGKHIPDFKLVDKYGNRKWIDPEDEIIEDLTKKFKKKPHYFMVKPVPKILSPAQMEKIKLKNRKKVAKLKEFINKYAKKPHTGYTIVPDTDRREAVNPYDEFDSNAPIMDDCIDI